MALESFETTTDTPEVVEFEGVTQLEEYFKSRASDGVVVTANGKRIELNTIERAWSWFVKPKQEHEWPEFLPSLINDWIEVTKSINNGEDFDSGGETISDHDWDALGRLLLEEMDKPEDEREILRLVEHSLQQETMTS